MKQRVAEGWRGGGSSAQPRTIPLTRGQRLIIIGICSLNTFMLLLNVCLWCKHGMLTSFIACHVPAASTLWLLTQSKGRW